MCPALSSCITLQLVQNNDNPNRYYESGSFHRRLAQELDGSALPLDFAPIAARHDEL